MASKLYGQADKRVSAAQPKRTSSVKPVGAAQSRRAASLKPVEFDLDGLRVCLTRKRVKNLNVRIAREGDHVDVSAPLSMPLTEIKQFIRSRRTWIDDKLVRVANTPAAQAANATPAEVAEWRRVVEACTPTLVSAWEPIMGVKVQTLAYRNMKSRWGSCQPSTGRICINVRLALYPPECLEYVVVHELCHLLERGHGPRFKELMDTFMPDWRARRAKLQ